MTDLHTFQYYLTFGIPRVMGAISAVTSGRTCIKSLPNRKSTALHNPFRIYSEQILAKFI